MNESKETKQKTPLISGQKMGHTLLIIPLIAIILNTLLPLSMEEQLAVVGLSYSILTTFILPIFVVIVLSALVIKSVSDYKKYISKLVEEKVIDLDTLPSDLKEKYLDRVKSIEGRLRVKIVSAYSSLPTIRQLAFEIGIALGVMVLVIVGKVTADIARLLEEISITPLEELIPSLFFGFIGGLIAFIIVWVLEGYLIYRALTFLKDNERGFSFYGFLGLSESFWGKVFGTLMLTVIVVIPYITATWITVSTYNYFFETPGVETLAGLGFLAVLLFSQLRFLSALRASPLVPLEERKDSLRVKFFGSEREFDDMLCLDNIKEVFNEIEMFFRIVRIQDLDPMILEIARSGKVLEDKKLNELLATVDDVDIVFLTGDTSILRHRDIDILPMLVRETFLILIRAKRNNIYEMIQNDVFRERICEFLNAIGGSHLIFSIRDGEDFFKMDINKGKWVISDKFKEVIIDLLQATRGFLGDLSNKFKIFVFLDGFEPKDVDWEDLIRQLKNGINEELNLFILKSTYKGEIEKHTITKESLAKKQNVDKSKIIFGTLSFEYIYDLIKDDVKKNLLKLLGNEVPEDSLDRFISFLSPNLGFLLNFYIGISSGMDIVSAMRNALKVTPLGWPERNLKKILPFIPVEYVVSMYGKTYDDEKGEIRFLDTFTHILANMLRGEFGDPNLPIFEELNWLSILHAILIYERGFNNGQSVEEIQEMAKILSRFVPLIIPPKRAIDSIINWVKYSKGIFLPIKGESGVGKTFSTLITSYYLRRFGYIPIYLEFTGLEEISNIISIVKEHLLRSNIIIILDDLHRVPIYFKTIIKEFSRLYRALSVKNENPAFPKIILIGWNTPEMEYLNVSLFESVREYVEEIHIDSIRELGIPPLVIEFDILIDSLKRYSKSNLCGSSSLNELLDKLEQRIVSYEKPSLNLVEIANEVTEECQKLLGEGKIYVDWTVNIIKKLVAISEEIGKEDIFSLLYLTSILYSYKCPVEVSFLRNFGDIDDINECRDKLEKIMGISLKSFWLYEKAYGLYHRSYADFIKRIFDKIRSENEEDLRKEEHVIKSLLDLYHKRSAKFFKRVIPQLANIPDIKLIKLMTNDFGLSEKEITFLAYTMGGRGWGTLLLNAESDLDLLRILKTIKEKQEIVSSELRGVGGEIYDILLDGLLSRFLTPENLDEKISGLRAWRIMANKLLTEFVWLGSINLSWESKADIQKEIEVFNDFLNKLKLNIDILKDLVIHLPLSSRKFIELVNEITGYLISAIKLNINYKLINESKIDLKPDTDTLKHLGTIIDAISDNITKYKRILPNEFKILKALMLRIQKLLKELTDLIKKFEGKKEIENIEHFMKTADDIINTHIRKLSKVIYEKYEEYIVS